MHSTTPSTTPIPYTTLFRSCGWSLRRHERRQLRRRLIQRGQRQRCCPQRPIGGQVIRVLQQTIQDSLLVGRRSEEHTSELQSHVNIVCCLLLVKKKGVYYYF